MKIVVLPESGDEFDIDVPQTGSVRDIIVAVREAGRHDGPDEEIIIRLEDERELHRDHLLLEIGIREGHRVRLHRPIEVFVNKKPVVFRDRKVTGLQIKETAIQQGVASIQLDFVVHEDRPGDQEPQVLDCQTVILHRHEHFTVTAPDDNS